MQFRGIMLGSENPKVLAEFYEKVFGKPTWEMDGWYGFQVGQGSIVIGHHSEVKGKNQMPGRSIINIDSDDVKSDYEKVKAAGAEVIAEPYQPDKESDPDIWITTFADVDGNYFQFAPPWKD